jgi:pyridoxamine 5'-phosphate oxidase
MEAKGNPLKEERLHKRDLQPDPFEQFSQWFEEAQAKSGLPNPNAMTLCTLGAEGWPEGRLVLLKSHDPDGFVFYTNLESDKGRALLHSPRCELVFHWDSLGRQLRIRGEAGALEPKEADAYFASRARESQIGAWASRQSREVASREAMDQAYAEIQKKYEGKEIPRPPHWSGFRVRPERFEFWQAAANRFHDRFRYFLEGNSWRLSRIQP